MKSYAVLVRHLDQIAVQAKDEAEARNKVEQRIEQELHFADWVIEDVIDPTTA